MAKRKVQHALPKGAEKVAEHAHGTKGGHSDNKGIAVIALLINALIMPGLGSIIGGRTKTGIWQLVLSIGGGLGIFVGVLLTVTVIGAILGIPLIVLGSLAALVGWIWGIVTGIQLLSA